MLFNSPRRRPKNNLALFNPIQNKNVICYLDFL